jgi:Lrp/AsnC family leucine-responsive transcriptional regulator
MDFGKLCRQRGKWRNQMPKALNDAINLRILAELQEDCSLTNIELAERVGLSPSPCLARVRALEEAGIILRRMALLDPVSSARASASSSR